MYSALIYTPKGSSRQVNKTLNVKCPHDDINVSICDVINVSICDVINVSICDVITGLGGR